MVKLLGIKAKTSSLIDYIGAGFIKTAEERMLSGIIGNGTLMSGGAKALIAAGIDGKGGKLGNMATLAFGVDAGEDIAVSLMGMAGIGEGKSGSLLSGVGGQQGGGDDF